MSFQMPFQDFTTARLPEGLRSIPARVFIWTVILFVVIWVAIGLISLRFPLTTNLQDVVYTQLIILGSLLIALANTCVMQSGGFNREGPGQFRRVVSYCPVASSVTSITGMVMLIWPVWTSFASVEPNRLLQVMFSLITIGLCGTFAGFVSLADVARIYRHVPWVLYVLIVLLAVEIMDGLWGFERLRADVTGVQFRNIWSTVATATVAYAFIAIAVRDMDTERSRIVALIGYFLAGIAGFTLAVWILWDNVEAGPHRFVLGAATLLAIGAVGLTLLHYYNHRPPGLRPQPQSPADPVQSGDEEAPVPNPDDPYSPDNPYTPYHGVTSDPMQSGDREPPAPAVATGCPGCGALVEPEANFCVFCGLRLQKGR